jgi:hypothetical protein
LDAVRPSNLIPVTGEHLRSAIDDLLAGRPVNPDQRAILGCKIKWKPGSEPAYYPAATTGA